MGPEPPFSLKIEGVPFSHTTMVVLLGISTLTLFYPDVAWWFRSWYYRNEDYPSPSWQFSVRLVGLFLIICMGYLPPQIRRARYIF